MAVPYILSMLAKKQFNLKLSLVLTFIIDIQL